MLMRNHGILTVGRTPGEAFMLLYYFERAAETLVTAYATGRPLRVLPEAVAVQTELEWRDYGQLAIEHLDNVKAILDAEESGYRD